MTTENQSWLQTKVNSQAKRIKRLEEIVEASQNSNLAHMYVAALAELTFRTKRETYREKSYVEGYWAGFRKGLQLAKTAGIEDIGP